MSQATKTDIKRLDIVDVSLAKLALCLTPLLGLAGSSFYLGLQLESPLLVGIVRTFLQLSILSGILTPIFALGIRNPFIVIGYVLFMVILASLEASARTLYYFEHMWLYVMTAFLVNITIVSVFAFGFIIQPKPVVWHPQYTIPIVGMLLGIVSVV